MLIFLLDFMGVKLAEEEIDGLNLSAHVAFCSPFQIGAGWLSKPKPQKKRDT